MKNIKIIGLIMICALSFAACNQAEKDKQIADLQSQIAELQASTAGTTITTPQVTEDTTTSTNTATTLPSVGLNETAAIEDYCEFTVKDAVLKKRIDPPAPDTFYTYYEAKDSDEIYLDVVIQFKNLRTSSISADKIASVKIIYDNKYEYTTFSTIEEKGGGDFTFTNITSIEPLKSGTLHFLTTVPSSFETDEKPLKAIIKANKDEYEFIIK